LYSPCVLVTEMHAVGEQIAATLQLPCVVYLQGELGAGKTTLSQGIANYFGYNAHVSSPTYNLIHEYPCRSEGKEVNIAHLDLYRLNDPEELEMLGLADLYTDESLFLIEWAEKGEGRLPKANVQIDIAYDQSSENNGNDNRVISVSYKS